MSFAEPCRRDSAALGVVILLYADRMVCSARLLGRLDSDCIWQPGLFRACRPISPSGKKRGRKGGVFLAGRNQRLNMLDTTFMPIHGCWLHSSGNSLRSAGFGTSCWPSAGVLSTAAQTGGKGTVPRAGNPLFGIVRVPSQLSLLCLALFCYRYRCLLFGVVYAGCIFPQWRSSAGTSI